MGTTLKQNLSLRTFDWLRFSSVRKFQMPFRTKEAGVSPGWTLDERKTVGLSNLNGLEFGSPSDSGKTPSIKSSRSVVIPALPVNVIISIGLFSLL